MLEGQEDCLYLNIYIPKIHGKGTNFRQKTLFLTKSLNRFHFYRLIKQMLQSLSHYEANRNYPFHS